jgi:hypothetical protein
MEKHWDESIEMPMYFCNEEKKLELPRRFKQIRTGTGSFVQNLKSALDKAGHDHVFYMLEDFWPIAPMSASRFRSLYDLFVKNEMDALQVSTYTPHYELESTDLTIQEIKLLKFKPESEWIFNFQARFWKAKSLVSCLKEPQISESIVSSAITVEIESDSHARKEMNLQVWLHHYFWYPITGVAYRGKLTDIGEQMQNVVNIEKFVEEKFRLRRAFLAMGTDSR